MAGEATGQPIRPPGLPRRLMDNNCASEQTFVGRGGWMMAKATREFRTRESLEAEKRTRDLVPALLAQRGFTNVTDRRRQHGPAQSQVIDAVSPGGAPMKMHVRLCWRRDGRNQQEQKSPAAQLTADLIDDDWDLTLARIAGREQANGNSHNLFVQADQSAIRW